MRGGIHQSSKPPETMAISCYAVKLEIPVAWLDEIQEQIGHESEVDQAKFAGVYYHWCRVQARTMYVPAEMLGCIMRAVTTIALIHFVQGLGTIHEVPSEEDQGEETDNG